MSYLRQTGFTTNIIYTFTVLQILDRYDEQRMVNGGLRSSFDQYNSDSEVVLGGSWYPSGFSGQRTGGGGGGRAAPMAPQQVVVDERSFSMPHVYGGPGSSDEMGGYGGQGPVSTSATWNVGSTFDAMSLNSAGSSSVVTSSGFVQYGGHQRMRTNSTGECSVFLTFPCISVRSLSAIPIIMWPILYRFKF